MVRHKKSGSLQTLSYLWLGWALAFSAQADVPKRSYLLLSPELSERLTEHFGVLIEEGLYFSDQWKSKLQPALRLQHYKNELRGKEAGLDLTYLRDGETAHQLYDGDVWLGADDEMTGRAGWVDHVYADGRRVEQLWLEKKNTERWLLAERPWGSKGAKVDLPMRAMSIPRYFIPVANGAVRLGRDWQLSLKIHGRPLQTKFTTVRSNVSQADVAFTVLAKEVEDENSGEKREKPLILYHPQHQKVLFASKTPGLSSVRGEQESELYLLDLLTQKVTRVAVGYSWPMLLALEGVWSREINALSGVHRLWYRPMDWARGQLGKEKMIFEFHREEGELLFFSNRYVFVDKADGKEYQFSPAGDRLKVTGALRQFVSLQDPQMAQPVEEFSRLPVAGVNVLQSLRQGVKEPRFYESRLNNSLTVSLSQTSKTWAQVLYKEGSYPEDILRSFLWGLDVGALAAAPELKELDAAFEFHSDRLFEGRNEADLRDIFLKMRKVTDGTQALLVLHDFPTAHLHQANAAQTQQRLQLFVGYFQSCIERGRCRVVTTTREEIFRALEKLNPGLYDVADAMQIADVDSSILPEVVRNFSLPEEEARGLIFEGKAFKQFLEMVRQDKKERNERNLASPGFEEEKLKHLFRFVDAERRRFPNSANMVLDFDLMKKYGEFRDGSYSGTNSASTAKIDFQALNHFLKRHIAGRKHRQLIDKITSQMEFQMSGGRLGSEGPPAFVVLGSPGVGKSELAILIAKYLLAGGKEAALDTVDTKDIVLFDMGSENGNFTIDSKSGQAERLKTQHNGQLVAIFDDLQKAKASSIAEIGQILDKGHYKRGTSEAISFNRIGAVFLTATWGSQFIRDGKLETGEFPDLLHQFLVSDDNGPKIDEGMWSRLSQRIFALPDLEDWELFEVAFIKAAGLFRQYSQQKDVAVLFDPRMYSGFVNRARKNGQGRAVSQAMDEALVSIGTSLTQSGVRQVVITLGTDGNYRAVTNYDEGFQSQWDFAKEYFDKFSENPNFETRVDPFLEHLSQIANHPFQGLLQKKQASQEKESF